MRCLDERRGSDVTNEACFPGIAGAARNVVELKVCKVRSRKGTK
jgi:hypothetical protein